MENSKINIDQIDSPDTFVKEVQGKIHTISLNQLDKLLTVALKIQQDQHTDQQFQAVVRFIKKRHKQQSYIMSMENCLSNQDMHLNILARKVQMLRVYIIELKHILAKKNEEEQGIRMLDAMLDEIANETEYQMAKSKSTDVEEAQERSYESLFRNIEKLPSADEKIHTNTIKHIKSILDRSFSGVSQMYQLSLTNKIKEFLSTGTNKILNQINSMAQQIGLIDN